MQQVHTPIFTLATGPPAMSADQKREKAVLARCALAIVLLKTDWKEWWEWQANKKNSIFSWNCQVYLQQFSRYCSSVVSWGGIRENWHEGNNFVMPLFLTVILLEDFWKLYSGWALGWAVCIVPKALFSSSVVLISKKRYLFLWMRTALCWFWGEVNYKNVSVLWSRAGKK